MSEGSCFCIASMRSSAVSLARWMAASSSCLMMREEDRVRAGKEGEGEGGGEGEGEDSDSS